MEERVHVHGQHGVDCVASRGSAPARAKVIPGNRKKVVGTAAGSIVAGDRIVNARGIPGAKAKLVDNRVEKSDRVGALAGGLLIDEGHEAGPQRRRATRAPPKGGASGPPLRPV